MSTRLLVLANFCNCPYTNSESDRFQRLFVVWLDRLSAHPLTHMNLHQTRHNYNLWCCWHWLNRDKIFTSCLALRILSCFRGVDQPDYLTQNKVSFKKKERFQLVENLQMKALKATCHLYFLMCSLLANASKGHSIPLLVISTSVSFRF